MNDPVLIERMAHLLEYPREQTAGQMEVALADLRETEPEAAAALAGWSSFLREIPLWQLQELYTQTFDLTPACSLDVGYYLFGEDYQRGLLLAHLRESMEELGLEEGPELPDHLPVLMRWLARVYGSELYTDMLAECVLPAMGKMDECLAGGENPYRRLLQAIFQLLSRDLAARGITVSTPAPPRTIELPMLAV